MMLNRVKIRCRQLLHLLMDSVVRKNDGQNKVKSFRHRSEGKAILITALVMIKENYVF